MKTLIQDKYAPDYKTGVGKKVQDEIDNQEMRDKIAAMLSSILRGKPSAVAGGAPMPTKSYADTMTMNDY